MTQHSTTKLPVCLQHYNSPCGELILASVGNELCLCDWSGGPHSERNKLRLIKSFGAELRDEPSETISRTMMQLNDYFAGKRKTFSIPLQPAGTPFQKSVWQALLDIPFGETRTYKDVALQVGNLRGVRAVAQAIGANGISILCPCHRVIGTDLSLTGFAGGLEAKRLLLELEGHKLEPTSHQVT